MLIKVAILSNQGGLCKVIVSEIHTIEKNILVAILSNQGGLCKAVLMKSNQTLIIISHGMSQSFLIKADFVKWQGNVKYRFPRFDVAILSNQGGLCKELKEQ
jgi:hypothetical protein